MLGDIAALTGGTFISEDLGIKLENVDARSSRPGQADRCRPKTAARSSTARARPRHPDRINQIRTQMSQTESEYDKEKFRNGWRSSLAASRSSRVGAATEAEMKQTKGRVEDASHATRAAVAEGIVAGGGMALLRAWRLPTTSAKSLDFDERVGAEIVARPSTKPIRTIAENGGQDGAVIADEVLTRGEQNHNIGFNANTAEYVDMFQAGIVDPTRVTRGLCRTPPASRD